MKNQFSPWILDPSLSWSRAKHFVSFFCSFDLAEDKIQKFVQICTRQKKKSEQNVNIETVGIFRETKCVSSRQSSSFGSLKLAESATVEVKWYSAFDQQPAARLAKPATLTAIVHLQNLPTLVDSEPKRRQSRNLVHIFDLIYCITLKRHTCISRRCSCNAFFSLLTKVMDF